MKQYVCIALLLVTHWAFGSTNEKWVVAGGSLTEIMYALGAEESIVGVDTSSSYPDSVHALPKVGYFRTLNVEGLLSVSPTKLIALEGAGPKSVLEQLEGLGVEIVTVNNPKTLDGLIDSIRQLATVAGREDKGESLINEITSDINRINALPALNEKSAVFLMSAGERGLVAAGENTTPQLIFDALQIINPFESLDGFKPISAESLAASSPDLILVASHTTRGLTADTLCQSPQLALWSKQKGCNLIRIDSLKYLGMTPRLPEAMNETYEYF